MKILVCNSGSSSLKFSLFEAKDEVLLAKGSIDWTNAPTQLILLCDRQDEEREALDLQEHKDALARILDDLQAGPMAPLKNPSDLYAVGHRIVHGEDHYIHLADLKSNLDVDKRLVELYSDQDAWAGMAILNVAASGKFSSDRTIAKYAKEIWSAKPCAVSWGEF